MAGKKGGGGKGDVQVRLKGIVEFEAVGDQLVRQAKEATLAGAKAAEAQIKRAAKQQMPDVPAYVSRAGQRIQIPRGASSSQQFGSDAYARQYGRAQEQVSRAERVAETRLAAERKQYDARDRAESTQAKKQVNDAYKEQAKQIRKEVAHDKKQLAQEMRIQTDRVAEDLHYRTKRDVSMRRTGRIIERGKSRLDRLEGGGDRGEFLDSLYPGLGSNIQHAELMNRFFPGAAGIRRALGTGPGSLPWIRGGLGLAPIVAGIASGSAAGGGLGGATSGVLQAMNWGPGMGLGASGAGAAFGAGLLGFTGVLTGAAGGYAVGGARNANKAAQTYRDYVMNGLIPHLGVQPFEQGVVGAHRSMYDAMFRAQGGIGLSAPQAASIAARFGAARGGWSGTPAMRADQQIAMYGAQSGLGLTAENMGELARARRMGGLGTSKYDSRLIDYMVSGAMYSGFEGQDVGGYLNRFNAMTARARSAGMDVDPIGFQRTMGTTAGMIGAEGASRFAFGAQGAMQNIASRGLAGSSSPEMALLLMTAATGQGVPRTLGEMQRAQQILTKGPTPELLKNLARIAKRNTPSEAGQIALMSGVLGEGLGVDSNPDELRSLLQGKPMSARLRGLADAAARGRANALEFWNNGGLERRAGDLAQPEAGREAAAISGRLDAGAGTLSSMQQLEVQAASTAASMSRIAEMVNEAELRIKRSLGRLIGADETPWSVR